MYRVDKNMSVYLTRGDACLLPIYCKNSKGESYIFRNGETLRFRVFRKRQCKEVVLVKDITVFEDTDRVELFLSPNEISWGTPAYKRVKRGTTLVEAEGRTPSFFSRGKSPRRLLDPKTQRKVWIPGT